MASVETRPLGWDDLFDDGQFSLDSGPTFFLTAQALANDATSVVEVGCGRGALVRFDGSGRAWQDLRGDGRQVIGIDIDPAGAENPAIDEFRLIGDDLRWPLADATVDLAVSDFVLEHVTDPRRYVAELTRTLRPGGVFIARTINRSSPLALAARLVPNRGHARVLSAMQPGRQDRDVFPTAYRMNSRRDVAALFGEGFEWVTASRTGLDHYLGRWSALRRLAQVCEPRLPRGMQTALIIVARRR